jgi:hypothetical protein
MLMNGLATEDDEMLTKGYTQLKLYKKSRRYTGNFTRIRTFLKKNKGFVKKEEIDSHFPDIPELERMYIYNRDFNPMYILDVCYIISPEHYKYNEEHKKIFEEKDFIRILVQGYDEWENAYMKYYGHACRDWIKMDMIDFLALLCNMSGEELKADNDTEIIHSDDESSDSDDEESSDSDDEESSDSDDEESSDSDVHADTITIRGLENLEIEIQAQLRVRNRRR